MMGDNRYNSEDSRVWGFVPFDHVLGKPVFIWMSIDGLFNGIQNWKFRRDRIFTCLLYTSPSPRDKRQSRMPSSA